MDNITVSAGLEAASGAEILFDAKSGISEEEQREILAGLDALAGKDRIELPQEALKAPAKKRGSLFPSLINGGGLLLLAAGIFLLYHFHDQEEVQIREGGTAVLGVTERRLIQEIRRETAGQISAKEQEIAGMTAKLEEVDAEYQDLQVQAERMLAGRERELREAMDREIEAERARLTAQNLSEAAIAERMRAFDAERILRLNSELDTYRRQLEAERLLSEMNLQKLQEEYRAHLAALQTERAQILEASRIREANQRAQLEERIGELSGRVEQGRAELSAAREELRRLSDEQDRARLVEAQLSGFYASVEDQIGAGRLKEAGDSLGAMREFLDTPSFKNVRALQTRRSMYLATIDAFQGLIDETLRSRELAAAPASGDADEATLGALQAQLAVLQAQNTVLEQANQEQKQTLDAMSSSGSDQNRRLLELQSTISALQQENAAKNQTMVEQDTHIDALQRENDSQRTQIGALQTQAAAQAQQVSERDSTITDLRQESAAKDQQISTLNQQLESIRQALQALSQ